MKKCSAVFLLLAALLTPEAGDAKEESSTPPVRGTPNRFYPHITTPAKTLGFGEFAFENFPGANGNTPFLLNSVSLGIGAGFQVGFVPLFTTMENHRYNANTKLTVWQNKNWQVGIGYSIFSIAIAEMETITEADGKVTKNPFVDLGFLFVTINYEIPDSRYTLGLNYAALATTSNSKILREVIRQRTDEQREWAIDLATQLNDRWVLTTGVADLRSETFEIQSPFALGFGASVSYLRKTHWFPRITTGLHYEPKANNIRALLSFDL